MQPNIRQITYKTFAKLCYYPDKELVSLLFENVVEELLNAIEPDGNNVGILTSWLDKFESQDQLLETLQVEYTHLFITSFPSIAAPMFKSFYYEKEILGESTERIMEIYNKFGFHVSDEMVEPADHLAILLEFIFRLIEFENSYDDQIDFIANEILSWIEKLEHRINSSADIPFYSIIINVIINFLKNDVNQYENQLAGADL